LEDKPPLLENVLANCKLTGAVGRPENVSKMLKSFLAPELCFYCKQILEIDLNGSFTLATFVSETIGDSDM